MITYHLGILCKMNKAINRINAYYKIQDFVPSRISILINPFYLIRRSLVKDIKDFAPLLNGRLLDFGCGSKPYKDFFLNAEEYVGMDVQNEGHSHDDEDVDVFYDGRNIPFPDNYFDSVFSSEVLEHVFELDATIKEIHRVLKPRGQALFTVPFVWDEHEQPNDFGRYTSFGVKYLFRKHCFQIVELRKTSHFVEVVTQLAALYIRENVYTRYFYLNIFLNIVVVAPVIIIGLLLAKILPKDRRLYFNNIVLVTKNLPADTVLDIK